MMRRMTLVIVLLVFCRSGIAKPGDEESTKVLDQSMIERIDARFQESIDEWSIPGGVVTLVEKGEIVHTRGFGVEGLEKRSPVDSERTLFYVASVTKTFTATAVMQLVEQGKLDLNADVNDYLDTFKVPSTFEQPVTLHHLLTHTAGFDDLTLGYVKRTPEETVPMGEYLSEHLPPRVMPPGAVTNYSNHGFGLAGHMVEIVSGMTFEDYVEENILGPLGMEGSTAHTPPPPALAERMATGHFYDPRTDQMEPFDLGARNLPPAGTIITNGADMGRFLIAHLQKGSIGDARILSEASAERMQGRRFAHDERLPGIGYGFWERWYNGVRTVEHMGGYPGWSALVVLIPDRQIGYFAAVNQGTARPLYDVLKVILDDLVPEGGEEPAVPVPSSQEALAKFTGNYSLTRYSRNTIEKLAMMDTQMTVAPSDDGYLVINGRGSEPTKWFAVEPLVFRKAGGDEYLVFREDERGRVTHFFTPFGQIAFPAAFERLGFLDSNATQLPYLYAAAAVFLSTFTLWPLAIVIRVAWRRMKKRPATNRTGSPAVSFIAGLTGILVVVFIAGLDGLLGNSQYRMRMIYGMPVEMTGLMWIPIITTTLTLALALWCVESWRKKWWTVGGRTYFTVVTVTALSWVGFLLNWRLLGFWYQG